MYKKLITTAIICSLSIVTFQAKAQQAEPFRLVEGIFDFNNPESLGLKKANSTETFTVFDPLDDDNHYNHGVVLFAFKDNLYAMWQTSKTDEDAPDTHIVYSISENEGKNWSKPQPLTSACGEGIATSGGWWQHEDKLIAFVNYWPNDTLASKHGYTYYTTSIDGKQWSSLQSVVDNNNEPIKGVIEQDLRALPNGRIVTTFHIQPGLIVKPYYTDDPFATGGWKQGEMQNLSIKKNMSRELEPSWYYKKNGQLVMVFRDQESSYKKIASQSSDNGETWSLPVMTNFFDSRAKQSAGNFNDGTAFQVNNPTGNKSRIPLVVTTSADGEVFDKAFLLRAGGSDLPDKKYDGKYKSVGYSYPKSIVWNKYLYVAYATNKEKIQISRTKCSDLQ